MADQHQRDASEPGDAHVSDRSRKLLESALERLGCEVTRWRGSLATVRRKGEKFHVSAETIATMIGRPIDASTRDGLVLMLADLLGLPPEASLLDSVDLVRPLLRPRLVNARELEGPNRAMCRREAWGELIAGITVGRGPKRTYVTTRQLDAWGLEFDEVMLIARENLKREIDTSHLHDVEGAAGLLAVVHDSEPAASAAFILEELLPGIDDAPGIAFSTPSEDALLLLPMEIGGGAAGLAALVQATYALAAERDEPLSEQVFWRHAGDIVFLPMTWVEEEGSRRVHLEAKGVVEDLLRYLGELD